MRAPDAVGGVGVGAGPGAGNGVGLGGLGSGRGGVGRGVGVGGGLPGGVGSRLLSGRPGRGFRRHVLEAFPVEPFPGEGA